MRFMIIVKANEQSEAGVMPTEDQLDEMGECFPVWRRSRRPFDNDVVDRADFDFDTVHSVSLLFAESFETCRGAIQMTSPNLG